MCGTKVVVPLIKLVPDDFRKARDVEPEVDLVGVGELREGLAFFSVGTWCIHTNLTSMYLWSFQYDGVRSTYSTKLPINISEHS